MSTQEGSGGADRHGDEKFHNERGGRQQRDSIGSHLFCARIRHGQYNDYQMVARGPVFLLRVANKIIQGTTLRRERVRFGRFCREGLLIVRGLSRAISIIRRYRAAVRDVVSTPRLHRMRQQHNATTMTTATANGRYDIMSYKGMQPETRRRVNRPVNVARINRAVSSHHKNVTLRRLPAI